MSPMGLSVFFVRLVASVTEQPPVEALICFVLSCWQVAMNERSGFVDAMMPF